MFKRYLFVLLAALLISSLSLSGCESASVAQMTDFAITQGYTSAEYEGMSGKGPTFLACGTGGRLDRIFDDGSHETVPLPVGEKNLTCLLVDEGVTLVGGLEGAMAFSIGGAVFKPANGVGNEHILGLTRFKETYYACTFSGKILSSKDGISWKTAAQLTDKPLLSVAADGTGLMAITNDTDIFKSSDGSKWDSQNYNTVYKGLTAAQSFSKLVNLNETFIILSTSLENPDAPEVMFSYDLGETWSFTSLGEINGRSPEDFYPIKVNAVRFYAGELLAACDRGRVLTFTDCPTCHLITETAAANLRAMAVYDDTVLLAGDGFEFEIMSGDKLRQNNISPEQALIEIDYGAILIDVRTAEEYNTAHIPGCLHIPVDEIAAKLPEAVPDIDSIVIFYCAVGARAQTALETAQQLGYQNVFNLGGLSDWPYDTE